MTDKTTAPRVTTERIDALVASLTYETARVPNTSTTIATARLPWGFVVAEGKASCVSPSGFDAGTSAKLAVVDAGKNARSALWTLEGYRLAHELAHQAGEGA
jgi:hypothetical protein